MDMAKHFGRQCYIDDTKYLDPSSVSGERPQLQDKSLLNPTIVPMAHAAKPRVPEAQEPVDFRCMQNTKKAGRMQYLQWSLSLPIKDVVSG
jgi:hypothetical protein